MKRIIYFTVVAAIDAIAVACVTPTRVGIMIAGLVTVTALLFEGEWS